MLKSNLEKIVTTDSAAGSPSVRNMLPAFCVTGSRSDQTALDGHQRVVDEALDLVSTDGPAPKSPTSTTLTSRLRD